MVVEGEYTVKINKVDTEGTAPGVKRYDIELIRQDGLLAGTTGTLTLTAGSATVVGVGTNFSTIGVRNGDIIIPAGATSPNQVPIRVLSVTSDLALETDYTEWDTEAGVSYTVERGFSTTINLGDFELTREITR